jgi:hypothetical protein
MINEQDLKKFFTENKSEISDNEFSKNIQHRLPERKSIFPQMVMFVCIVAGLSLTIFITGFSNIETQLWGLINSVAHLQMPSFQSVMTYLGVLAALGFIGFAVADTDVG